MINVCIYRLDLFWVVKTIRSEYCCAKSWFTLYCSLDCNAYLKRLSKSLSKTIVTCLYMLHSVVVVFANSVPTAVKPTLGCTSWCCWTTCRLWALRTVKAARSHSKRECCQFCLSAEQDFTASSCPTFQESTSQVNQQCFLNSLLLL